MIDWHSHILPGIDDGSRNLEESSSLLHMLWEQGVKTVVATPHFYANRQPVEEFLRRRRAAFDAVKNASMQDIPEIRCGAEVRYYPGISRLPELRELCIEGTELLLLEMPGVKWTELIVRELVEMAGHSRLTLILAHIERYMGLQSEDTRRRLYESGILMQSNADCFARFGTKHKAIRMLRDGEIHLIGSDCHNLSDRVPHMDIASRYISKKLGENFLFQLNEQGNFLLNKK